MFKIRWLGLGIFLHTILICKGQKDSLFSFTKPAMGTLYHLHFYANDEKKALIISEKVFERIIELDNILSDYKETAEVYQINYTQPLAWRGVSKDLGFMLKSSIKWSKISQGNFDPALGSLTQLWRRAQRRNEYPADSLQYLAMQFAGIQHIALRKRQKEYQFKFKKKGVKLDFGGIGKGYAVDEALKILKINGVFRGMVSAGSSIALGKAPPNKLGWLIVSGNELFPISKERFLKNTAQSISGDENQYLEWQGRKYSHLLDPQLGIPLINGASCLVEGSSGMITDALGTALSVMNSSKIHKLMKRHKNIKAICKIGEEYQIYNNWK